MTEVAGHASSVGDRPDHVRLSRIEVDMEAGAPGEAPQRRHPSTHRLCGGKQIQHLPETTAGAPAFVLDAPGTSMVIKRPWVRRKPWKWPPSLVKVPTMSPSL